MSRPKRKSRRVGLESDQYSRCCIRPDSEEVKEKESAEFVGLLCLSDVCVIRKVLKVRYFPE